MKQTWVLMLGLALALPAFSAGMIVGEEEALDGLNAIGLSLDIPEFVKMSHEDLTSGEFKFKGKKFPGTTSREKGRPCELGLMSSAEAIAAIGITLAPNSRGELADPIIVKFGLYNQDTTVTSGGLRATFKRTGGSTNTAILSWNTAFERDSEVVAFRIDRNSEDRIMTASLSVEMQMPETFDPILGKVGNFLRNTVGLPTTVSCLWGDPRDPSELNSNK